MTWEMLLIDTNAIICLMIVIRLMFFSKQGKTHRPGAAWMAYVVILASGFTAFRIILGHYSHVDIGELLLNGVMCFAIWQAKGNMNKLFARA